MKGASEMLSAARDLAGYNMCDTTEREYWAAICNSFTITDIPLLV